MCSYVALIRVRDRQLDPEGRIEPALLPLPGVDQVSVDQVTNSVIVQFDRDKVSLGDIVRAVEDAGLRVSGVAQSRLHVGVAKAAIA